MYLKNEIYLGLTNSKQWNSSFCREHLKGESRYLCCWPAITSVHLEDQFLEGFAKLLRNEMLLHQEMQQVSGTGDDVQTDQRVDMDIQINSSINIHKHI